MSLSHLSAGSKTEIQLCRQKEERKKKAYYFRYYTTTTTISNRYTFHTCGRERVRYLGGSCPLSCVCVWVRNGSFPSVGLAGALNFKSAFPIALRDPVMMATLYSIIRGSSSSSSLPIYNCTLPMHIHHHNCAQKNIFPELE
jgi:hypothetical protein